jgi:uncharacterized protein
VQFPFKLRDLFHSLALSIGVFAVLFILLSVIGFFVPNAFTFLDGLHPLIVFSLGYLIQFVVLFLPLWFLVIKRYKLTLKDFGFKKIKVGKVLKTVLVTYFIYIVFSIGLSLLLTELGLENLPGYQQQESYLPFFGYDAVGFVGAFILVSILAPFLEEFFFRGFVYGTFTRVWPLWLASISSAVFFALLHFQFQTFIPLFILGLILNYTYQRTGSLWTSMAFHSLNNTIAFGLEIYLYFHPELLDQLTMSR